MRWNALFIPTLREDPADAEAASHRLLVRAGYVRPLAAGIYSHLFLGRRSLLKITAIVREEMDRIGAQEVHLPALHPAELWMESGRWEAMGENLFRFKDRAGRALCLGMTHEEIITSVARTEVRSYKQLPQIWYQIQTKFRDEVRPKGGLLRLRQFLMKDSYSFDLDAAGLDAAYEKHRQAYARIFQRCGVAYIGVEADSGQMGGSESQEFMVRSEAGEDLVVVCPSTGYAANLEAAVTEPSPPLAPDPEGDFAPEAFHTPGRKTIAEVAEFTGLPATSQIKSLVLVSEGKSYLALLRGDHQLSETKFLKAAGTAEVRPATGGEILNWFGAEAGSLGPVGAPPLTILTDNALRGRRNLISGANRDDYHLRHVTPGRDFPAHFRDLRQAAEGDMDRASGAPVEIWKALEVGHIFKLGYKYTKSMGMKVTTVSGEEITPIMGSYGIGIERILCAAVELQNDPDGIVLPPSIAPFEVVITPVFLGDETQKAAAERIYAECLAAGLDALFDDRDERPGVKFKDADLIGVPWRINVGRKIAQGMVEVVERKGKQTTDVKLDEVVRFVSARLRP